MAITNERITDYSVFLHSGLAYEGLIFCSGADGFIGALKFYRDGEVPPNGAGGGSPSMNYAIDRLSDLLDVLRNEDPVWFRFDTDSGVGYIATAMEPAGELDMG